MKQVKTSRMIVTLALVAGMLVGTTSYGGTTTLNGGTLTLANYYSDYELAIAADSAINVARNFTATWNGALTGSAQLTKSGAGELRLTAASSGYSGAVVLATDGGRLTLREGGTLTGVTSFTVNPGSTLFMDDTFGRTTGRLTGRPIALQGGTLLFNAVNTASQITQSVGAVTLPTTSGISAYSTIIANSGGTTGNGAELTMALTRNVGDGTLNLISQAGGAAAVMGNSGNVGRIYINNFNGTAAPPVASSFLGGWLTVNTHDFGSYLTAASGLGGVVAYGSAVAGAPAYTALSTATAPGLNGWTSGNVGNMTAAATLGTVGPGQVFSVGALRIDNSSGGITFAGTTGTPDTLHVESGGIIGGNANGAQSIGATTSSFTRGILTAGAVGLAGSAPVELFIHRASNNLTINSVITDNPGGGGHALTLIKSSVMTGWNGGAALNAANTYSGGTQVIGSHLTASVAGSLGSGAVKVNNATLTLSAISATSNSTGADYTAVNGAQINIATLGYTSSDTFNIAANSVISGGVGSGTGLNSLDRGIGGGTANITLVENAIIGHNAGLAAALNLSTGTIKNLGTSADLYYGLTTDQNNALGQITIGSGTAFKGISSERTTAKTWSLGTINVATGTTDVYFQGLTIPGTTPTQIVIGNGATAGSGAIMSLADAGTLNVNVLGSVQISDTDAVFGNTSTGRNVKFVVTEGSTLTIGQATGMGNGTGIASATVKNGGTMAINNAAAINGAVTIEAGGMFTQNQAALTGTGSFIHTNGSILNLTSGTSVSGATQALGTVPGTIVRIGANPTSGTSSGGITQFDERLNDAAIYQLTTGITFTHASSSTDSLLTLNSSGGIGGILINDLTSRSTGGATGTIKLGANGGLIAATSNTTLTLGEDLSGGGALTIGTTNIIDGAPKLGTVLLNVANTHTGGTTVNAGTLQLNNVTSLGSTTGQLTVNTGGTLNMSAVAQTVGNLTGSGGIINAASKTLTIGQGDTGGGNFQGSIQGASAAITKTGTGTITLSGANTYSGLTTVSGGGTLVLDYSSQNNSKLADGAVLTLSNGGGELTLRSGSHVESVGSLTIGTGGHTSITRDGGSATIAFGVITKGQSNGGTMSLAEDNIATTTTTVFNGILGGGITVGSNWAKVVSGNIVALTAGDYTALPTGATTASVNYQLTGSQTHTGSTSLNSLRIVGDGNDQMLTISSGNLTPSTTTSVGTLGNSGGILYAGGGNNNYTITGGGNIQGQNGNQELIINTYTGILTVDMAVTTGTVGGGAGLTKSGAGTLILTKAGTYNSTTYVNQGTLLVNNTTGSGTGTGAVTVNNGAVLGGTGTVGGNVTIAAGGGLTFDLTTAPGSHDKLELAAGKTLTFSGTSTLTITASGILTEPGIYTLVTAPGGISGTLPATVNLPTDYAATVQVNGTDLQLNVTGVPARGGPLDYFEFSAITSPQVAGTPITGITLTAKDAGGLTSDFNGTVTFSGTAGITGDSGSFTQGVLAGLSVTPTVAGSGMTIIVTGSGKTGMATFDVSPGALDHFDISAIGSPQTAGTAISGITLTAQDANNNTVTGFVGTVTYGGAAGISGTSAPFTAGELAGVSVTPTVAGSGITFTVTGSGKTGTATFNVNPGAVHHFAITGFTPTGVVGTPVTGITITAQDANNNTVTGFSGTVTYGGTAGITGVSGAFTAGVLADVSVTPTEAGTGVTFTVSDGSGHTGSEGSDVVWVDGMVMMAAASVQVGTTAPVASVRANSPYPPVTYAITGGRDEALFNLDSGTGELTLKSSAGSVGTTYYVLVQATDSKPITPNVDSILVEVTSTGAAVLSGSVFMFR